MTSKFNINFNEISIDNWKAFVENNETIENELDLCCSNVADMIANANSLRAASNSVNEELSRLKTVPAMSLYVPIPYDIIGNINDIHKYMQQRSLVIFSSIEYAEKAIEAYEKGEELDSSALDTLEMIAKGIDDAKICWLAYAALKNTRYAGLGFIMAYGSDAWQDEGKTAVGDGAAKLFEVGTKFFEIPGFETPVYWLNATIGGALVTVFTLFLDKKTDEGEFTVADEERRYINAVSSGLEYAGGYLVAAKVSAAVGGSLAGPVGMAAGVLITVPLSMLFNTVQDHITGDNIIAKYTKNKRTYEIPANGNGEDRTFDVIIERYGKAVKKHTIHGRECSEYEYKNYMYTNVDEFVRETSTDVSLKTTTNGITNPSSKGITYDSFKKALDAMVECDTLEEGIKAYHKSILNGGNIFEVENFADNLQKMYDFDLEEYYKYNHK